MKLTKKQINALNRIVSDEKRRNANTNGNTAGLHPSGDGFAITDGSVVVLFNEKPDGFPEAKPFDYASSYILEFAEKSDCVLVEGVSFADECRCLIREWKQAKNFGKAPVPVIQLKATDEKGYLINSWFDARKLLNVIEAMGAGALVYIGEDKTHKSHRCSLPCVLVKRKNWMSGENDYQALLLPFYPTHGGF